MFSKNFATFLVVTTIVTFACYTAEAQVVQEGLVHYWSFDNIKGDTIPDHAGDNNAMIMHEELKVLGGGKSDPKIVKGKFGMGLEFDGDGDYVESMEEITITGSDPRTLGVWVKFNSFPNGMIQVPVGWGWDGETDQTQSILFSIASYPWPEGTNSNFICVWGISNDYKVADKELDEDTWYYVTAVYDNETDLKVYFDGNLEYSNDDITPFSTGTSVFVMGKKLWTYADRAWFDGTIDEVSVYDRALSKAEVKQNSRATLAIESTKKLAITWGDIKVSR